MSENETNFSPDPAPRRGSESLWLIVAILIAAGLFAGAYFLPVRGILPLTNAAPSEQAMEMERRIHTLEDRVNILEARLTNAPQDTQQKEQGRVLSSADLGHMQNDLAQMQSALDAMQDQVKQTGTANRALAQGALAKIMAFVQLREAARSNHSFVHELETMRASSKGDAALKDVFGKLAPYADIGAPNMALLREELAEQSSAAEVANAKAKAQTWWERILAEFHGLVMVREVNGGAGSNTLDAIKAPLAQDNLSASLDALKNQPQEVQQTLANWRERAEARLAIDDALTSIADHLAKDSEASPQPSPPAAAPAQQATPDKDEP